MSILPGPTRLIKAETEYLSRIQDFFNTKNKRMLN